jgi:hypothetical protein
MPKQHPYSLLSVLASGSWLTAERAKALPRRVPADPGACLAKLGIGEARQP